jgi:RND family efflux transporter MFP subunit
MPNDQIIARRPAATDSPAEPRLREPPRRGPTPRRLRLAGIVALCVAAAVVIAGVAARLHDASKLQSWTAIQSIPPVSVILPIAGGGTRQLVLPGSLQADYNAPIYSRVSGYVRAWHTDIGARVKAGQLMATIDTPELDQQLIQARADLETARANMQLASTTARRWASLLAQDAVSKQETEEKAGDLAAKTAQVDAAQANVGRLLALKAFARIVAPFDGVVTARRTDIGDLVNAGAGAAGAGAPTSELFDVAKVDKLRLYVHVPQRYSSRITPGMTADLTVPEYPGRAFKAKLTSTSEAVSDSSGTLLVELAVDNADGALKTGDYAQVTFNLAGAPAGAGPAALSVPAAALLFRKEGSQVATVNSANRVVLKPVVISADLGQTVEIGSGLAPTDRVIDNPPDSIATGDLVRVVKPAVSPAPAPDASPQPGSDAGD